MKRKINYNIPRHPRLAAKLIPTLKTPQKHEGGPMNLALNNDPIAPLFSKNIIRRSHPSLSTRTKHFKTQVIVKNPTRKIPAENKAQLTVALG